jgi:hypothetical protein
MRTTVVWSLLIAAQVIWTGSASGQTPAASAERRLTLIPTALEELNELRVNTGTKAILRDGTMNAVYVKKLPAKGNTYLNFHVDISSGTGPIVLRASDIRLQGVGTGPAIHRAPGTKWKGASQTAVAVSYTPMDWFLDTGIAEERGESLTVHDQTIVQFTIEVPRAGLDDLTLSVLSQRIGTVREIRARIARVGEPGQP